MISNVTDLMVSKEIIKEDEREIYEYGLKIGAMYFIDLVVALVVAIILNEVDTLCISVITIGMLRRNAGGFHAKTIKSCFVLSELYVIGDIVVAKFTQSCPMIYLSIFLFITLALLVIVIWTNGVVPGNHIDMDRVDLVNKKYLRKVMRRIGIILCIGVISILFGNNNWLCAIIFACLGEMILLIVAKK